MSELSASEVDQARQREREALATAERFRYERDELLAISRLLSSERDIRKLLDLILAKSRQITGADAGSVYVLEADDAEQDSKDSTVRGKVLHFMLSQNDSLKVDLQDFRMRIDERSIVGKAVLERRPFNIPDLGRLVEPEKNPWGFRHDRSFDERTGYRARSMLTVPMLSTHHEVIGVIQLINKKRSPSQRLLAAADFESEVVAFDPHAEELALALASQAGICLENAMLYKEITALFEGFVDASVTAIESRDPTTSGHSRRVATLTVALAQRVDAVSAGELAEVHFTPDDLRQIEYAGVLHDFGKVGVREAVLTKAKKLHDWQRAQIELRFRFIRKSLEAEVLTRKLALLSDRGAPAVTAELLALDGHLAARLTALDGCWDVVAAANEPALLSGPVLERLKELGTWHYVDVDGSRRPYLEPDELAALAVTRGSLTPSERLEIESHVTHTISFLQTIPWGRSLRRIPHIAGAHHESLDGKGYPARLSRADIPIESRMLTIADIYDALTASDRPYKAAVPLARALDIIASEVKAGRCDPTLFDLFVKTELWKQLPG